MDKESTYLFQCIDCCCNDCKFMERDIVAHNRSELVHHLWQLDYFIIIKNKILSKAREWTEKGEVDKAELLFKEAKEMKFVYQNTSYINYGYCNNLKKNVTFMPNTCQLDTQVCFKHRKDNSGA